MLFYILRESYPMLNSYFYKLTIISFQLSHLHFKSINYTSVHLHFIPLHRIKATNGKVSEKRDLACIIIKHNKNALRLNCYNFRTVNAIVFLFSALHTIPFLYCKIHWDLEHAPCQYRDVRYPKGFKPAITFGRSNQIAPNSVCR